MFNITSKNTRRALLGLLHLSLACRLVIPAGYMPAPLGQGGPIMLCPGGFFGAVPGTADNGHAGHYAEEQLHHDPSDDGQSGGGHAGWEHCPVGAVLAAAALTSSVDLPIPVLRHLLRPVEPAGGIESLATQPYQARAPPSTPSIDA